MPKDKAVESRCDKHMLPAEAKGNNLRDLFHFTFYKLSITFR